MAQVFGELDAEASGTFAETCVCSEGNVAVKPKDVLFSDAAALPVAAVALGAIRPYEKKISGKRVLVLGGSAATGAYICQLCKNVMNAGYIGATSSKVDFCLRNGCDVVIDYKNGEKWWDIVPTFDIVFDCVGGSSWQQAHDHLPTSATFVTFVPIDGPVTFSVALSTVAASIGRKLLALAGAHCSWDMVMADPDAANLTDVANLVVEKKIIPLVDSIYDFTLPNVIEMLQRQKAFQTKGRQICQVIHDPVGSSSSDD